MGKKSSLISMPAYPISNDTKPPRFESRDVAVCCGLGTAVRKLSKQLVQAYNQNIFSTSDSWQNKACSQKGKVLITRPPVQPSEANPAFSQFSVGNGAFRGTMLRVPNVFHISQYCIIRAEISSFQKQAPVFAPLPHLLLRMETHSEGLGHEEPGYHPFFSCAQDKVALNPNDLCSSKLTISCYSKWRLSGF